MKISSYFNKKKVLLVLFSIAIIFLCKRKNHDNSWYLRDFKYVLKENVKSVPNFLSSKEVQEDTIFISFDPIEWENIKRDYRSLNEIGRIFKLGNSYCNVRYTAQGKLLQGKARLKGQMSFHWEDIDRLSFKINLKKKGPLLGMSQFALHHPRARNYMDEVIYYKILANHNLMTLNFSYLRLVLNNEDKGIYNIEEVAGKEFIERNGYRESAIFKSEGISDSIKFLYKPKSGNDAEKAQALYSAFIKKKIKASKAFNVVALGKLFAISDLIGYYHSLSLRNMQFYFNPITNLIEPIGHDNTYVWNTPGLVGNYKNIDNFPIEGKEEWVAELFKDEKFVAAYYKTLNEISDENYLDNFWDKYQEEVDIHQKILYKSYPTRRFRKKNILEKNRLFIKNNLETNRGEISPVSISYLLDSNIPIAQFENSRDTIIIDKDIILNKPLVLKNTVLMIKKGVNVNFIDSAFILSYSTVIVQGSINEPVLINSSDSTGLGIHLIGNNKHLFRYLIFDNLGSPNFDFWKLSGGVTCYNGNITLNNVIFSNNRSEDALNLFSSTFVIDSCRFDNIQSDAFDSDFSNGSIMNSSFYKVKNDGIDASGSQVNINNVILNHIQDKGLSAGEKSTIQANNLTILNTSLAINSKDLSVVNIENSNISNGNVAYIAFMKKEEYGGAEINVNNVKIANVLKLYLIENKSNLKIDGKDFGLRTEKVKKLLYVIEKRPAKKYILRKEFNIAKQGQGIENSAQ
jgi:hypothetical protein